MNRIRALRVSRGWTQEELAQMLNASRQAISGYETEFRGLDVETIHHLCDIFNCTSDYLLCRSSSPDPAVSDADAALLQAFHAAPANIAAAIQNLLEPFKKGEDTLAV